MFQEQLQNKFNWAIVLCGLAEWAKANKIRIELAKHYSLNFYWPIRVQGYKITA